MVNVEITSINVDENWTRIYINLPVNDSEEVAVAKKIASTICRNYGGGTYSTERPSIFRGWWKSCRGEWMPDAICWLFVDVPYSIDDEKVEEDVEIIRFMTFQEYFEHDRYQEEIWTILGEVYRVS